MVLKSKERSTRSYSPRKFCIGREDPELCTKTKARLVLFEITQFKIGSDVNRFLMQEKLVQPASLN